jgi:hypothetical protein
MGSARWTMCLSSKVNLPEHSYHLRIKWCKIGRVASQIWGRRIPRSPPCGKGLGVITEKNMSMGLRGRLKDFTLIFLDMLSICSLGLERQTLRLPAAAPCRFRFGHHTVNYVPFMKSQLVSICALCSANLVTLPLKITVWGRRPCGSPRPRLAGAPRRVRAPRRSLCHCPARFRFPFNHCQTSQIYNAGTLF